MRSLLDRPSCRACWLSCGGQRRLASRRPAAPSSTCRASATPTRTTGQGVRPWQYPVHGIDVSKYQGDIDWHRVRASGIDFAFIKATEGGDHTDDRFRDNWAGRPRRRHAARRLPLLLLLPPGGRAGGLVHQPRPARPRRAAAGPRPRMDPQVEDLPLPPRPRHRPPRGAPLPAGADRLLRQAAGHLHHRRLLPRQRPRAARRASTSGCARWPAHPSDVYPNQRWAFWQYTGTGVVEGVDGPTDINVFGGTRSQWASWANGG